MSDSADECLAFSYRLLRFRQRSERELRQRLARRGFDSRSIDATLSRLKSEKLVDDVAFASFWVDNRLAFNPRSRQMIARELAAKGVGRELVAAATGAVDDEAAAYRVGLRKMRVCRGKSIEEFRQFLLPFLLRRGFGREVSVRAVERLWAEARKEHDD